MKRFIVTHTSDYYSGGPSIAWGWQGDFDSLPEALACLKGKMGSCSAADILDTEKRRVMCLVEDATNLGVWEDLA